MNDQEEFTQALRAACGGLPLSGEQIDRFYRHLELLRHWNRRINLTRVITAAEAAQRHYAESVLVANRIENGDSPVLDMGSGAGFPGIPVAILHPSLAVTLLESDKRKAAFLREAIDGLPNASVEAVRSNDYAGREGTLTARGVRWEDLWSLIRRLPTLQRGVVICGRTDAEAFGKVMGIRVLGMDSVPWAAGRVVFQFHVERLRGS